MNSASLSAFIETQIIHLSTAGSNFYQFMDALRELLTKHLKLISKRLTAEEAQHALDAMMADYWSDRPRTIELLMKMHPDFTDRLYPQLQCILLDYSNTVKN
jgi:hypothetical protein